jgi:hypothetical protein
MRGVGENASWSWLLICESRNRQLPRETYASFWYFQWLVFPILYSRAWANITREGAFHRQSRVMLLREQFLTIGISSKHNTTKASFSSFLVSSVVPYCRAYPLSVSPLLSDSDFDSFVYIYRTLSHRFPSCFPCHHCLPILTARLLQQCTDRLSLDHTGSGSRYVPPRA